MLLWLNTLSTDNHDETVLIQLVRSAVEILGENKLVFSEWNRTYPSDYVFFVSRAIHQPIIFCFLSS